VRRRAGGEINVRATAGAVEESATAGGAETPREPEPEGPIRNVLRDVGEAVDRRVPEPEEIRDETVDVVEGAGIRAPDDANFISSRAETREIVRESPQSTRREALQELQQAQGNNDTTETENLDEIRETFRRGERRAAEAVEAPKRAGVLPNVAEGAVEELTRLPRAGIEVAETAATTTGVVGDRAREAQAEVGEQVLRAPETAQRAAARARENPAETVGRVAAGVVAGVAGGAAAQRGARRLSQVDADIAARNAAQRVAERSAPVVRRQLEGAGVDVDRFTPLRRRTKTVGTVSRPARGFTRIRELRRAGPDASDADTVEPDITVPAGEPGPFGRVREPKIQPTLKGFEGGDRPDLTPDDDTAFLGREAATEQIKKELEEEGKVVEGDPTLRSGETVEKVTGTQQKTTLDAGLEEVEVVEETTKPTKPIPEAQGDAFLAKPVRGFKIESKSVAGSDADITTRGDVGTRAEVGSDDFGGGEGATVEAQTGQTGVPAAALELEQPGLFGRLVGRESELRVRGEVPDEATQAAVGRIMSEFRRRRGPSGMRRADDTRAELQLAGGSSRTSPEAAAREAITESEAAEFTERGGRLGDLDDFGDEATEDAADVARAREDGATETRGGLVGVGATDAAQFAEIGTAPLSEPRARETTETTTEIQPETPTTRETGVSGVGETSPTEINPLGEFRERTRGVDRLESETRDTDDTDTGLLPLSGLSTSTTPTPATETRARTETATATDTATRTETRAVTTTAAPPGRDGGGSVFEVLPPRDPRPRFLDADLDIDEEEKRRRRPGFDVTETQFLADFPSAGEVLFGKEAE
jgi:hypothetical protein